MTLLELQSALQDGGLRNRVEAACCKAAVAINYEAGDTVNHTARYAWARSVLQGSQTAAANVVRYVCAAYYADHPADPLANLTGMIDSSLQSYVDAAANLFAGS